MPENKTASTVSNSKPNLLFITQRIPYPPIKGEKIRSLQILKHFAQSYNVYLGCLIDDPQDWVYADTVRDFCVDAYFAGLDRKKDYLSHIGALLTGQALSVSVYRDRGLARWISKILREIQLDAVFVSSSNMAPYVLGRVPPTAVTIVDLVDVDSEKWRSYAQKTGGAMRWIYKREARLISALESRIAHETAFSAFVSEPEAAFFRSLVPGKAQSIVGVPNGIDHVYFEPDQDHPIPYEGKRPTFVFTGTMDYIPNIDAVTWFAREILPRIKRSHPTAQFYIVGSSPSAAVLQLEKLTDVHVTGRVADVRPYLAHATAGVAPMRIARGIQNKVMEAMAMGKPVIVTPDALEGIEAVEGKELILATDGDAFAQAAVDLIENPDRAQAIGLAARKRMVEDFSWDGRLRGFDLILKKPA